MARTNLHESATEMLECLERASVSGRFEGKLRTLQAEAGLSSGRSAEAIKLLEDIGRITVKQRGRRSRDTIIALNSNAPVTMEEAAAAMPEKPVAARSPRINYDDLGRSVIDRLIELGRNDALRSAQVEAFASEAATAKKRVEELETSLEEAAHRETDLRIKLRAAEESLERAEENLRRAFSNRGEGSPRAVASAPTAVPDDDARAVLDILRSRQ